MKLIHNEVFNHQPSLFDGPFSKSCQIDSVPPLLKSLVSMLLNGINLDGQGALESQACLTVSQLVSVPPLLKSLLSMLLNGINLDGQGALESQACII